VIKTESNKKLALLARSQPHSES